MNTWVERSLGELIELQRGHDLPTSERRPGSVPVIGSFGITGVHNEARYPGPGVTIGRSGAAIGKATFVAGDYWPLNTCLFVRDFKGNDPRWIYRVLDLIDFHAYNSGSAQPSLNRNLLRAIPVLVPPQSQQVAIAEVLGALDDKIAANATLAAAAEDLMRSIAASTSETTAVSQIARQITTQRKPEFFADEVAHFSLPAFDDGSPELTSGSSIMSNKFEFERPVVLMSKLNPRIPRLWNVPVLPARMALASTEFVVLEPSNVGVCALWSALAQRDVWGVLRGKVAGTSGSHQRVKPSEIMSLSIRDPRSLPTSRQEALEALGMRCQSARDESLRLAAVRDALLPGLMSGAIRVKDAEQVVGEAV